MVLLSVCCAGIGRAQTSPSEGATTARPPEGSLEASARWGNLHLGGALTGRLRFASKMQLGLSVVGLRPRKTFIAGYETKEGVALESRVSALGELAHSGPLILALEGNLGVRHLGGAIPTVQGSSSTRLVSELGYLAHVVWSDRVVTRLGPTIGFDYELAPTFDVASLSQLLTVGGSFFATKHIAIAFDFEAGGSYGFDGNNEKFIFRGNLGLVWRPAGAQSDWVVF